MKMPLIILRRALALMLVFFLLSACAGRIVDTTGNKGGIKKIATLQVPAHVAIVSVNGIVYRTPGFSSGELTYKLKEGLNVIVMKFDAIYDDDLDDEHERVRSDEYSVNLMVREHEEFELRCNYPRSAARAKAHFKGNSGSMKIIRLGDEAIFTALPHRQGRRHLREVRLKDVPLEQLKFWWKSASQQEKDEFELWIKPE